MPMPLFGHGCYFIKFMGGNYMNEIIRLILEVERFRMKSGKDLNSKNDLIKDINLFTKSNSLQSIYVNEVDNIMIPDVYVLPAYSDGIGEYLINTDTNVLYSGKYTIEIHERCFTKYSSEELTALLIHCILQNILSNTAKTRFLMAYTSAIDKYKDKELMDVFSSVAYSEVAYLIFMDICMRPFNLPINDSMMSASDEVLKAYDIVDAYESAISKIVCNNFNSLEDIVETEVNKDNVTATTIIKSCVNGSLSDYYDILKDRLKMISVNNIKNFKRSGIGLGFTVNNSHPTNGSINESLFKPTNDTELQFQIDKIVTAMRYAENEDERTALLFKVKTLRLKLLGMKKLYMKQMSKDTDKYAKEKINSIDEYLKLLDNLRMEIVKMEIVPKRYGVFIKYPEGYDY